MHSTNDISVFIKRNDIELRRIVSYLRNCFHFIEPLEDIVQDIYLKFHQEAIIEKYNPYWNLNGGIPIKMSTYIYKIIRNYLLTQIKSPYYRMSLHKDPKYEHDLKATVDVDKILQENVMNLDYENTLITNLSSDSLEGLGADVRDFEKNVLKPINKKLKRKTLTLDFIDCSLETIFELLYEGYSNKEIAEMYNVPDMTISNLKNKIVKKMLSYGFRKKSCGSIKMPQMQRTA